MIEVGAVILVLAVVIWNDLVAVIRVQIEMHFKNFFGLDFLARLLFLTLS